MTLQLQNPSRSESKLARQFLEALADTQAPIYFASADVVIIRMENYNRTLAIPKRLFNLFVELMKILAAGTNPVYIFHSDLEITTQQAADILNISRPHLIKLLEKGEIPFKKAGAHRKILVADIYHYGQKMRQFIVKTDLSGNPGMPQELDL